MRLIGLVGPKYSGKTTVAGLLRKYYGFASPTFGEPLKRIAQEIWGFSDQQLRGGNREEIDPRYGYSPRHVLQMLGNDIINSIDGYALTYPISRLIQAYPGDYVLEDLRSPTQTAFIKDKGGFIWRLHRDTGMEDAHSSEDIDWILGGVEPNTEMWNEGSIEELNQMIDLEIRRMHGQTR